MEMARYGLVWNPHKEGLLLTGSEDCTVKLWYGIAEQSPPSFRCRY